MASIAIALLALGVLPSAARAANTDPTVYEKQDLEGHDIPQVADPSPYMTLQVPAGQWVGSARIQTYTTGNIRRLTCTLTAGNGTIGPPNPASSQSGYVTTQGLDEFDTIALNASITSLDNLVTFTVSCRDESSTLPTGVVQALQTRIVVMRLSSLTQSELQGSSASAGGVRSTSPAVLIHGYTLADRPIEMSSTPKTVATLPLEAGLWSIRTTFSILSLTGDGPRGPINGGQCRILLSANGARATQTADRVPVIVGDLGQPDDREAYYLDTAGRLGAPGAARLQCWQTGGSGDLVVKGLRITALKAGTLKTGSASIGSASVSYGRGLPIVRYMRTHSTMQISGDFPIETVVGNIKLPAGIWYVFAKLNFDAASIQCHLYVPELGEGGFEAGQGQLVLGRITELEGYGTVNVACLSYEDGDPPIEVSYIHITAIRVKLP